MKLGYELCVRQVLPARGADGNELIADGYQFLNLGADVLALTEYFGRLARAFDKLR